MFNNWQKGDFSSKTTEYRLAPAIEHKNDAACAQNSGGYFEKMRVFWQALTTCHRDSNQIRKGRCVSANKVPAVTEVCRSHPWHGHTLGSDVIHVL